MKKLFAFLSIGTMLTGVLPAMPVPTTVQVGVDINGPWSGWMNVYDPGGGYLWGKGWGTADLPATFTSAGLKLSPNVSVYNPADPYWVNPDGTGAKNMEANVYVDLAGAVGGQTLGFSGNVISYSLQMPYYSIAFIKEFTSTYGWVDMTSAPLIGGQPFSVSRTIAPGNFAQYGFLTYGLDANPATVDALGFVLIEVVPEPSALGLIGLGLLAMIARRRRR